jgi:hypothetical protein
MVSRRLWSTRSNAERSNIRHRSMPPTEQATSTETGVLHFDEWGKKEKAVSRFSQSEIREALNDMSNDPTSFNARVAAAQAENAEWHRQHPTGWAGTTGCNPQNETERRALADAATAAGRDLRYSEKQQIIDRLRQR